MTKKGFLILIFSVAFLAMALGSASAAPINDTFHLNLQTTFSNGTIQTGTFNFAFNITDNSSASCSPNVVYNYSTTLATDARGIVSIYLPQIGDASTSNLSALNYDTQYYLCYYRNGALQEVTQLGRVPYAFRATQVNLSEINVNSNLNLNNSGRYNITANYGFFSFLGSIANAISQLFVTNANVSNNLTVGGNLSVTGNLNVSGLYYGNGSQITGILGSQINNNLNWINSSYGNATYYLATNPFGFYNSTTLQNLSQLANNNNYYNSTTLQNLSQLSNNLNFINGTYGNQTYVLQNNISNISVNNSQYLGGYPAGFFMPLNKSVSGNFDFNGGWQNNGLSISGGSIFAQAGYFYNISSLNVTNLNTNGSFVPILDNQFDIGNSSFRYRNLYLGGTANITGATYLGNSKCASGYVLTADPTTGLVSCTLASSLGGVVNGSGTQWYIPMFNSTNTLNNSAIYQNGSNIGIGTTSPTKTLHVNGSILATNFTMQPGNRVYTISLNDPSGSIVFSRSDSSSTLSFIPNTGYTDLRSDGASDLYITNTNNRLYFTAGEGGFNGQYYFGVRRSDSAILGGIYSFNTTSGSSFSIGNLTFPIFYANGTSGNIGIGTTSPGAKLDVLAGNAITSQFKRNSGDIPANIYSDIGGAGITSNGTTRNLIYIVPNDSIRFYGNGSEVARIQDNGNVGINSTNPASTFNVIGTTNLTSLGGNSLVLDSGGNVKIGL